MIFYGPWNTTLWTLKTKSDKTSIVATSHGGRWTEDHTLPLQLVHNNIVCTNVDLFTLEDMLRHIQHTIITDTDTNLSIVEARLRPNLCAIIADTDSGAFLVGARLRSIS